MNHNETFSLLKQLKEQGIRVRARQGELKVSSENGVLDPETVALIKAHKRPFLDYFCEVENQDKIVSSDAQRFEPFALNENQQAYWLGRSQSVEGGGVAIHLYFEIEANALDMDKLHTAWATMVQRHDMLRAVVTPDGHQQVLKTVTVPPFTVVEAEGRFEAVMAQTRQRLSHANYDLTQWPQHQFEVVVSRDKQTLCLSLDCWCIDGWSYQILFQEWLQLYRGEQPLPSIELTFRDYSCHVGGALSQAQIAYIDHQAQRLPAAPTVPERRRSSTAPVFQRYERWLTSDQTQQLKSWCASQGVTLAATLLTLYAEVLHLWSSDDRFTVNVPRFNRNTDDARIQQIIGEFATFSLVGFDFGVTMDRRRRIEQAQRSVLESVDAGVSGVEILRKRNALTDSVQTMPFVFTNAPEWVTPSGEKQSFIDTLQQLGRLEYAISQTPQVKIDCQYHESRDGLYLFWDARDDQFYPDQVGQMFKAFIDNILGLLEASTQARLPEVVPMALSQEPALLQGDAWADLSQAVTHYPNRMAVACAQGELTWSQLAARVNALASQIAACALAPHQPILIMAEKGWQQIAAYLAIHHQGHIAVPVDGSNPIARLQFIADDTQAPLVLCSPLYRELAAQMRVSAIEIASTATDEVMRPQQTPSATMLIIYTSGSTGLPKGVKIAAAAMHNAVNATIQRFQFDQQDVFFGLTQLHHDMAWFDLLAVLKTGGTLVCPASQDYRDPQRWLRQMAHYGVTCWNSVPQLMQMLLAALKQTPSTPLNAVRVAFLGGDWIPLSTHSDMQAMLPNARLVSVGGPTETTLWNIMYEVTAFDHTWSSVPYGQPIANNQYRILDRHGRDCPNWVEGELCCSGVGVTPGYVNRPELEQEKFFEGKDGQRYYRTGDLGRYRSDGLIEFIGRQDDQIMVGGYRIESQEIHRVLESHPAIKQAQVVVDGHKLQAYLVPEQGHLPEVESLNAQLEARLPAQMIPSLYFVVECVPLTANGKVDKSALSSMAGKPLVAQHLAQVEITRPEHRAVAVLWEQVLGRAPQTPHDDFFLLGGHSLAAVELFALMFPQGHDKHSVVSLFELRTVKQHAALMADKAEAGALTLSDEPLEGAELSQGQKRICFVEQMSQQPHLFNLPFRIALRRGCELERLQASLERTLSQFDVFQAILVEGRWARMMARPSVSVERSPVNEAAIEAMSREQAQARLELAAGLGWRARLVTHEDGHHELLLTVHHALFDGWSLQVLLKAWQDNYCAEHASQAERADYFNYCQWESQAAAPEHELAFWRRQLDGYQDSALLPTQLVPQYDDYSAATEALLLDASTVSAIRAFSEAHGSTEFAVMMAAFQLLISRYLAQDDVVIGTHVANRPTAQIQSIPGLFLNNVAIRQRVEAHWCVEQLIAEQTQTLLAAMKHSTLPFERVVSEVDAGGEGRRHPLYQISFVLDNSQSLDGELGCVLKPSEQVAVATELEMNVQLCQDSGRINLVYRTGLFTALSMRQLLAQYQSLLNQMLAQPLVQLRSLCYNSEPQEAVLEGPSLPCTPTPIRTLWQSVVETSPHSPAYMDEHVTRTFAQLDERAQILAQGLSSVGIGAQSRVGVHLELGEEWLVSLLAIVKLSACYVPLATNLPNGRLEQMATIAECDLVLGRSDIDLGAPYVAPNHVSDLEPLGVAARDPLDEPLLYVTFTSGSTGTPKAVAATEVGALNRFAWTWQQMPFVANEVCALKTSISFVDSIAEVFTPLLKGVPLALIPTQAQYDPEAFAQCIAHHDITRLVMVPSLMETLVEHSQKHPEVATSYRSLSQVVLSGETLSLTLARRVQTLWPDLQLWNVYGSAEVAADVLAKRIDLREPYMTLGRPFFNTRIELRDNWGGLTPAGGKGELMISGPQVIGGYLGETPFPRNARGEAIFASGDIAQIHQGHPALDASEVVFVGRQQQLVKIRGQKVSLAEIRETLVAHDALTQLAVVMVDEQRIGVMYTPDTVPSRALQSLAEQYLPRYMRPQVWCGVGSMPLLATGKVDVKAVTAALQQQPDQSTAVRALTETENAIAELWQALTGICPRDPDSHFFDLGGHSLLVNSLTNALNQAFGLSLRLGLVYDALVLSELAELIETLVTTPSVQSSIKETGVI